MHYVGCQVNKEAVLITSGCQETISIGLQTVAKTGDIIAIESPTFYALEQWQVTACVLTPNFSNPLGGLMPNSNKQALGSCPRIESLLRKSGC